jgi:hypothetical protein
MRQKLLLIIFTLLLSIPSLAQTRRNLSGWCEDGGQTVTTSGLTSTTKVQRSYPQCTVTVYDVGTTNLATIASDSGGTPKANPFTASTAGRWDFWAVQGQYDVQFSGGGISSPFTRGGLWITTPGASGDVVGPSSATDNAAARFDLTTGKLIQNSVVVISDVGNISGVGTLNLHTIPSVSASTFVLTGATQTLTNKTFTSTTNILGGVTMSLGSDGTGDMYFRNASGFLTRLGIGSTGQCLIVSGGVPTWSNDCSGSGGGGTTPGGSTGQLQYNNGGAFGGISGVTSGGSSVTFAGGTLIAANVVNTGTISFPTSTDTLVGRATTDTLTNKTFTASSNILGSVTLGIGGDATGDIYYTNASTRLTRLAIGTAGQVLTVSGGLPIWGAASAGSMTVGSTAITSGTAGRLLYETAGNLLGEVSGCTSDGTVVTCTSGNLVATTPTITTSLVTGSTTFSLINTTATTVNFAGAATTLNIGTSATVLNFGGGATAAEFRFLEPSGSGTNYTSFKAQAQGANVAYTLPPDDGDASEVLTTNGSGSLTWEPGGGGGGLTVGTTTITSGSAGRLLYETAGNVLGEVSGVTSNGTTLTVSQSLTWSDGVTQTFNPDATNSGFNFGSLAGGVAPSSADDGDGWYGSTENRVNFQINGQVQGIGGDSSSISLFTGGNQVFRGSSTAFGIGTLHTTWSTSGFNPVLASVGLVCDIDGVLRLSNASTAGATFTSVATSPAQITSNQDNYNPGAPSYFQRWNTDASRNVTGLTFTNGKAAGQYHVIWNVGAQNIVLTNEDAASTAANRFVTTTGANITIAANGCARVMYDATSSRWRTELCN